jgi:hypothetical protein
MRGIIEVSLRTPSNELKIKRGTHVVPVLASADVGLDADDDLGFSMRPRLLRQESARALAPLVNRLEAVGIGVGVDAALDPEVGRGVVG